MIGISEGVAFLTGVAVGAAGQYFADKYTDRRRSQEHTSDQRRRFREVADALPDLIREIAKDFAEPDSRFVRELVLSPQRGVTYNTDHPVFMYYEDEHANLRGQFAVLENHGYVSPLSSGNIPRYHASEEFVQQIARYRG